MSLLSDLRRQAEAADKIRAEARFLVVGERRADGVVAPNGTIVPFDSAQAERLGIMPALDFDERSPFAAAVPVCRERVLSAPRGAIVGPKPTVNKIYCLVDGDEAARFRAERDAHLAFVKGFCALLTLAKASARTIPSTRKQAREMAAGKPDVIPKAKAEPKAKAPKADTTATPATEKAPRAPKATPATYTVVWLTRNGERTTALAAKSRADAADAFASQVARAEGAVAADAPHVGCNAILLAPDGSAVLALTPAEAAVRVEAAKRERLRLGRTADRRHTYNGIKVAHSRVWYGAQWASH